MTPFVINVTVVSVAELGEDCRFDFENSKLIGTYFGTQHWEDKYLPEIRQVVAPRKAPWEEN